MSHKKNLDDDRPILSAAKCRPMIVVSKNIRCMRIIRGSSSARGRHLQIICYRYRIPASKLHQPADAVTAVNLWRSTVKMGWVS